MQRVHYVKAERANLCLDCDTIYSKGACPVCGSNASWPISHWLNRVEAPVFPFHDPDHLYSRRPDGLSDAIRRVAEKPIV